MPNLSNWLNDQTDVPTAEEAFDISFIMVRRGQVLTLIRGTSTAVADQMVIVAPQSIRAREVPGSAAVSGRQQIILIGYRDFLDKPNFDVQRGDRVMISGTQYRVTYIDDTIPGRREATAEATQ